MWQCALCMYEYSQWNFVRVNVLYDLATQFGVHPWYWYLTHGLPTVLGAHLPLALLGLARALRSQPHAPAPRTPDAADDAAAAAAFTAAAGAT